MCVNRSAPAKESVARDRSAASVKSGVEMPVERPHKSVRKSLREFGAPRRTAMTFLAASVVAACVALASGPAKAYSDQPVAPKYPTARGVPFYYKDDAAGAFFQRYAPTDISCAAARDGGFLGRLTNPLKCVQLGKDPNSFISVNGAARIRNEFHAYKNLGVARTLKGGRLDAAGNGDQVIFKHYELLGTDLHITKYFRAYGQIVHAGDTGHNNAIPPTVGNNRNDLTYTALFGEGRLYADEMGLGNSFLRHTIFGLRAGRENAAFGSDGFWFSGSGGPAIPATTFDGFHFFGDDGPNRLDAFFFHPVSERASDGSGNTIFASSDNASIHVWGLHFSHDLPQATLTLPFFGVEPTKTGMDFFYYGYSSKSSEYQNIRLFKGAAPASLAAAEADGRSVSNGSFIKAPDYRHEIGLRVNGSIGHLDYDYSGVIQRGSFGAYDVDAYAFHTTTAYNLGYLLPWDPALFMGFDYFSGGVGSDHTISTFQPIRATGFDDSTNAIDLAPSNLYVLTPGINTHPNFWLGSFHLHHLGLEMRVHMYWRANRSDAIYNGPTFGFETASAPGSANPYGLTSLASGNYVGIAPRLNLDWHFAPHLSYSFEAQYFMPGKVLSAVGAHDTLYLRNQITYSF
jgi:Alginate export